MGNPEAPAPMGGGKGGFSPSGTVHPAAPPPVQGGWSGGAAGMAPKFQGGGWSGGTPKTAPVAKQEDMIDRTQEGSPTGRIKEVGAQKGRKLPSDGVKKVKAPGSGGSIQKEEAGLIEAGESSADGAAKGIKGSGEHATKAVKKAAEQMTTPKAPKPPQAAGAKPTMHKALPGEGAAVKTTVPAPPPLAQPPTAYDASLYQPKPVLSPIKEHLKRIKPPMGKTEHVVNEPLCKRCGKSLAKGHAC